MATLEKCIMDLADSEAADAVFFIRDDGDVAIKYHRPDGTYAESWRATMDTTEMTAFFVEVANASLEAHRNRCSDKAQQD